MNWPGWFHICYLTDLLLPEHEWPFERLLGVTSKRHNTDSQPKNSIQLKSLLFYMNTSFFLAVFLNDIVFDSFATADWTSQFLYIFLWFKPFCFFVSLIRSNRPFYIVLKKYQMTFTICQIT